jgi:hypothetical protein
VAIPAYLARQYLRFADSGDAQHAFAVLCVAGQHRADTPSVPATNLGVDQWAAQRSHGPAGCAWFRWAAQCNARFLLAPALQIVADAGDGNRYADFCKEILLPAPACSPLREAL